LFLGCIRSKETKKEASSCTERRNVRS
jgi:hypothetical protein